MTLPIIPKSLYPLVPNVAGVPTLLRSAAIIVDGATGGLLGVADALDSLIGSEPDQWGIFDEDGDVIAVADSVISLDFRNGAKLADYPLEQGGFSSFNKVCDPFSVRVRMTCGGTDEKRADFVDAIDAAANSLDLYTVLTPETTYSSVNIESWEYRREAHNGAHMIIADLFLREVRETATALFIAPKTAAASPTKSLGQVQAAPVASSLITPASLR